MNNIYQQLKRAKDTELLRTLELLKITEKEQEKKYLIENFNNRPLPIRISQNAINILIEENLTIFDVVHSENTNQRYYKDHNPTDEFVVSEYITGSTEHFHNQCLDIITIEEKKKIASLNMSSAIERDSLCSPKISVTDLYGTDRSVISQFWASSQINQNECYDPCAFDGRWGCGANSDIIPMSKNVENYNFFDVKSLPPGTKYIVCNCPFSLFKQWIDHCLELTTDAYVMCNGDVAIANFNGHIKEFWTITGCDGNQKDGRSKCEFDVTSPAIKSTIWSCIAHFTRDEMPKFTVYNGMTKEMRSSKKFISIGQKLVIDRDERIHELHGSFKGGLSKKEVFEKKNV